MKKHDKHEIAEPGQVAAPLARSNSKRRFWLVLLICLVGSAAFSFVVFKYFVVSVSQELAGTWQVTEGAMRGATLEFRSNGTAVATRTSHGKKEITHSSFKVAGNTIYLTDRDDVTGKIETVRQTIVLLQNDELVIRDEDQNVFRMRRIRKSTD